MRKSLTDLVALPRSSRAPKRYAFADPELRGHYVRVQPSGAKAFVAVTRGPAGTQIWTTLGGADVMTVSARPANRPARSSSACRPACRR